MRMRLQDTPAVKEVLARDSSRLFCPVCAETEVRPVLCEAIMANDGGRRVLVQRCNEHGKMTIGNVYTDAYMTAAHPDLEKIGDGWEPRVDGLPKVEDL